MKKILTLALAIGCGVALGQKADNVGIGTTKPDPSALLELNSNSKGFLLPRMTETQRDAIKNPSMGLVIFQTDKAAGTYTFDGTAWQPSNARVGAASSAGAWDKQGNGLTDASDYIGTKDNSPLIFRTNTVNNTAYNERMRITATGQIGIGTATPTEALEIGGGGAVKAKILSSFPRTYLVGKDVEGFHWFAADPTVSEPGNIMMGIRRDPTTDIVTDLYLAPGGNYALRASGAKVLIGDAWSMSSVSNDYSLFVSKGIMTEKIKVAVKNSTEWADYVFAPEYKLIPLEEVERYTLENKHLPNVPSADEMVTKGLDISETSRMFMEKIEELTLHIIGLNKRLKELETNKK